MENHVDNENTLKLMKSFDFKSQVKVTLILEDSDEEESPPPKSIKKDHNGEKSQTKLSNVADNATVSDTPSKDILVTNNKLMKENKTHFDKLFSKSAVFKNNKTEHAPTDGSSSNNNYKQSCNLMSAKEKNLPENGNNDKSAPKIASDSLEKQNDDYNTNQTGDQGKGNYLSSLLEAVSDHLIIIIESWFCHLGMQNDISSADQQSIDNSKAQFLQVKNHFFNLSYSTVAILILPEEKNDSFNVQFLNDTIKRAYFSKGMDISYPLVYGLYFEMIKWVKNKKESIKTFPARMQASNYYQIENDNNYSTLKQHLNKLPSQQNFMDTKNAHKTNNQLTADASKNLTPVTPMRTVTSYKSTMRLTNTTPPQSDYLYAQVLYNNEQTEQNRVQHVNPSPYLSTNATNNYIINQNMNMQVSKGDPPSYRSSIIRKRCHGKCCIAQPAPKTNTETEQSCIFSSGPPGRQITINVEQDALNRNQAPPPPPPGRQITINVEQDALNRNQAPLPPPPGRQITINVEQNALNRNQAPTNFNTAYNSFIASRNHRPPQKESRPYKRQPHSNEQRASTSSQQMQFPLYQQGNVANQGSIAPALPPTVPTYYTVPAPTPSPYLSWQNQKPTLAQQNFSAKQPAAPAQQFRNEPVDQQNVLLESTRSVSTDSGFTSPLHFTSTEGMNNTSQEEETEPQSAILITHVTSLNPKASFIKEDQCHVCRKLTSKMCLGCFRIYYCSADCQKSHWSIHKNLCKNK